ncbi:synaptic vesicle glycoprotein 2C-like [Hyposmocoma kahamanoa]|uniref:synaptic vesicle glycoprotein 2C-like n=1 Tax=Hyposmocoma kahamanoa TaxID=1477025 RepID=UPI000E6DA3C2|nr:synaptic vesicle glycoprotein 2C-like [Hyposmocoma kahamanoa]
MFGFSVVVASGACDLELALTQVGVLASVPFAGVFCAFPWGYYADTRGRLRALLLSASVGFLMAALSSLSPNWQVLLVLKLFGCFFSTASMTLTMTYLGECTISSVRNRYFMYMSAANLSSECVFYLIAYFILPLSFRIEIPFLSITYRSWRLYTFILAIPLGLGALMLLLLHESPKFLASRGEAEKALKVLRAMYKANGGNEVDYPVKMLIDDNVEATSEISFWESLVKQTVPLFKPPLLWRTLQLFYLMALSCSNNNLFLMWYPVIANQFFKSFETPGLEDKSFCDRVVANLTGPTDSEGFICDDTISTNTIFAGILLGITFGVLGLIIATLARWRQFLLIGIFASAAICLLLTNILRQPVMNMIVFTFIQDTAICIGLVASYFVDIYPTTHRALATSLSMLFTRIVSLGGVNLMGIVIVEHCIVTFYVCALYVSSGVLMSLFLPSEKKLHKQQQQQRKS